MDDERERSIRRSEAELQRRLSSFSAQSPLANEEEIYAHYNICLKMCSENKITEKNVWHLRLIDYMRTMLISKFQPKQTLQVAGVSLEVSTKIYGVRVDDVHSNTLKLANNMVRTGVAQNKDNDVQNAEEIVAPQKMQQKNKRRLVPNEKGTVSKNIESLLGDLPKLKSNFFWTQTDSILIATNLFSSTLNMHFTGFKFMLLNCSALWITSDKKKNISNKKYPITIDSVGKIKLCSAFDSFEIDEWNIEDEHQFDVRSNEESGLLHNDEEVLLPELDGTIPNIFENFDAEVVINIANEKHRNIEKIDIANSSIFIPKTQYFFGTKRISRLWAGPSYWKFKLITTKCSRFSGTGLKNKKTHSKKRIPEPINFFEDNNSIITKKECKRKSISTEADYSKCTLPEKFWIESNPNRPLILKPLYICESETDILKLSYDCNDQSYDTNDQQSIQNDFFNDDVVGEHETVVHQRATLGENLVDAPEIVENIYIPYASKAKRIDIKILKRSLWKTLTNSDDPNELSVQKKKFSEVYEEIPKHVSKKMKNELSCPLAFVALLHLANENNLFFSKIDNQNDFFIEKKNSVD
ncbi:hypothetical protein FQR65_LT08472 [Abscondita terminalis]|nr:hypothetical protein FQR65_LT08472 [Abscondita terminalis]